LLSLKITDYLLSRKLDRISGKFLGRISGIYISYTDITNPAKT
jgi:hypothetical protein